jgi:hypothetical protein
MELGKGESLSSAALRSGMSENTARRHRMGGLPGQRKSPRQYRTRPDPFARVWPEVEAMLEQAPGLEAVTIFEALRGRAELSFSAGQLRTALQPQRGPDRIQSLWTLVLSSQRPLEQPPAGPSISAEY